MDCLICGKDAEQHHYREDAPASGKGMGGAHPHLPTLALCRLHHEAVHARTLALSIEGEEASWEFREGGKGRRALVVRDDTQDPLYGSDAALCALWDAGEGMSQGGRVMQAHAAYGFFLRYGWAPGWYARAADLIRDTTGCSVSVGTVYNRAAMGIALAALQRDPQEVAETLGPTVLQAIGKAADPEAAAELAYRAVMDDGRRRTEVAREIAGQMRAVSDFECTQHVCRRCGAVWS